MQHVVNPVNQADDIYHLAVRAFQAFVGFRVTGGAVIPAVVAQGNCGIMACGRTSLQTACAYHGVQMYNLVFLRKPLPGRPHIEADKVDFSNVMECAAVHGILNHLLLFPDRVAYLADMFDIIKKSRFFIHDDFTEHGSDFSGNMGVYVNMGCKVQ